MTGTRLVEDTGGRLVLRDPDAPAALAEGGTA